MFSLWRQKIGSLLKQGIILSDPLFRVLVAWISMSIHPIDALLQEGLLYILKTIQRIFNTIPAKIDSFLLIIWHPFVTLCGLFLTLNSYLWLPWRFHIIEDWPRPISTLFSMVVFDRWVYGVWIISLLYLTLFDFV